MESSSVKISIIVPVFNVAPYIEKCIESIRNQTLSEIEIILVDDGSTDQSGTICDEFGKKDSRILVLHKENGGLSSARNIGIAAATGKYIGFVDGDDWIATEMYQELYELAETENGQIVTCRYREIYDDCDAISATVSGKYVVYNEQETLEKFFLKHISESVCDKIFERSLFTTVRFSEGEINEDTCVVVKLLMQSRKTVQLEREFYFYRKRKGSITRSGYSESFQIVVKHMKQIASWIMADHPDLDIYMRSFFGTHYFYLLLAILNETDRDKYKSDYKKYFKEFSKCFFPFIRWGTGVKKDRILALLLIARLEKIYILYKKRIGD